MSDVDSTKPGAVFYAVATFFLLWNLMGMMFYYMSVTATPADLAAMYNPQQLAFVLGQPAWATAAYATAVTTGVLASIMLLMRKSVAKWLFVVSFIAVLLQDLDSFVMRDGAGLFSAAEMAVPVVVFVLCVVEIWYSRSVANRYYR